MLLTPQQTQGAMMMHQSVLFPVDSYYPPDAPLPRKFMLVPYLPPTVPLSLILLPVDSCHPPATLFPRKAMLVPYLPPTAPLSPTPLPLDPYHRPGSPLPTMTMLVPCFPCTAPLSPPLLPLDPYHPPAAPLPRKNTLVPLHSSIAPLLPTSLQMQAAPVEHCRPRASSLPPRTMLGQSGTLLPPSAAYVLQSVGLVSPQQHASRRKWAGSRVSNCVSAALIGVTAFATPNPHQLPLYPCC